MICRPLFHFLHQKCRIFCKDFIFISRNYGFLRFILYIFIFNFCDHTTCRKLAENNLLLARYDFEPPATLDDIEIAAILAKADELVSWVTDVKEYALRQALSGVSYDGFKVVEGRSNRKYTDENAVVEAVKSAGFDPYEHSVLGITAMTALLGKKKFTELLGGLIEKPQGKPTLVPMSDKRPAIHTANEDFKEDK